jgi:hypothetical protein
VSCARRNRPGKVLLIRFTNQVGWPMLGYSLAFASNMVIIASRRRRVKGKWFLLFQLFHDGASGSGVHRIEILRRVSNYCAILFGPGPRPFPGLKQKDARISFVRLRRVFRAGTTDITHECDIEGGRFSLCLDPPTRQHLKFAAQSTLDLTRAYGWSAQHRHPTGILRTLPAPALRGSRARPRDPTPARLPALLAAQRRAPGRA